MKTNKQDLVTLAISSPPPPPPHPTLFCLSLSLLCECLHSEMGTEWAKLGLEVRLADETLECSRTDRFSLLGKSFIKACKVDLFLGGVKCSISPSICFIDGHLAWKAHFLLLPQSLLGQSWDSWPWSLTRLCRWSMTRERKFQPASSQRCMWQCKTHYAVDDLECCVFSCELVSPAGAL